MGKEKVVVCLSFMVWYHMKCCDERGAWKKFGPPRFEKIVRFCVEKLSETGAWSKIVNWCMAEKNLGQNDFHLHSHPFTFIHLHSYLVVVFHYPIFEKDE